MNLGIIIDKTRVVEELLYINTDKPLDFRVMDGMTTVVDNLLECLTIELCKEKTKNVIISCNTRLKHWSLQ